jgi:hypothetical protein
VQPVHRGVQRELCRGFLVEILDCALDAAFKRFLRCFENLHPLMIDIPIVKITRESARGVASEESVRQPPQNSQTPRGCGSGDHNERDPGDVV